MARRANAAPSPGALSRAARVERRCIHPATPSATKAPALTRSIAPYAEPRSATDPRLNHAARRPLRPSAALRPQGDGREAAHGHPEVRDERMPQHHQREQPADPGGHRDEVDGERVDPVMWSRLTAEWPASAVGMSANRPPKKRQACVVLPCVWSRSGRSPRRGGG